MIGQRPPSGVQEPMIPEESIPTKIPEPPTPPKPPEAQLMAPPLPKSEVTPERKQQSPSLLEQIRKGKELSPATQRRLKERPPSGDEGSGSPLEALRKHMEARRPAIEGIDEPEEEETTGWDD
jgi:hypothetical protein